MSGNDGLFVGFDEEFKLNLEAVVRWQMNTVNLLIMQAILDGKDVTDPAVVKEITEIVAERTKTEFGI
jgi:hypothetical protein